MESTGNREQPTDDASLGIGEAEPLSEVLSSDSLMTLKDGLTREQMDVDVELTPDDIHLGCMVEKGLIEYESLDKPTDEDEADCGDYRRRLTADSAVSGHIEELVKEMRNEFMKKALSKAKNLKSTLIKRGIMCGGHKSEQQLQPELSSGKQEDTETEETQEEFRPEEISKEDEINQLVVQINEFTTNMEEGGPDSADWEQFRGSLSKVCQIYQTPNEMEDPEPQLEDTITEAEAETETETVVEEPLQYLKSRAKELSQKISGMECKMVSLDQNIDVFCDKLDSSKIGKERAERDMAILQCMHERIGRRLAQMEVDLRQSRECLLNKTKTVLDEMKRKCSACGDGDGDGDGNQATNESLELQLLSPFPQST
ncbi:uncharacterized protein LOC111079037 [Drosophila obscura]|uniref:uncharacterized protein LOC111079037 n=1 Tax=Drosophila obscura TaxID=7282 RepID=UPI001BB25222|nr:uncharacterized protein LOC111079037 [Drosophila obscura]